MAEISSLFVTRLYRARLNDLAKPKIDYKELKTTCEVMADDDEAGQVWCEENGYPGYTSYASLNDLPWRAPIFADLQKALDRHVAAFVEDRRADLATARRNHVIDEMMRAGHLTQAEAFEAAVGDLNVQVPVQRCEND